MYQGCICWRNELKIEYQSIFCFAKYLRKKTGIQWSGVSTIYSFQESLWMSREGGFVYDCIVFGISMKIVKLIKTVLKESYIKACIGKCLSGTFPIQNGLKQECAW
jgi:hypothetical protein